MEKNMNLEGLSETALYTEIDKELGKIKGSSEIGRLLQKEESSDTLLGKAFYALSRVKKGVNTVKTNYGAALKHARMFEAVGVELIKKDKCYAPILAKNAEIVKNLMFSAMKTHNDVYAKMVDLSRKFTSESDPGQLKMAKMDNRFSFEYIGELREFLSDDGKNSYAMEVHML